MASVTKTHVVKLTGVPDVLLELLDERVSSLHYGSRAAYIRELLRRDLLNEARGSSAAKCSPPPYADAEVVFARSEHRD